VQRNIDLSELRQIIQCYGILMHRCIAALSEGGDAGAAYMRDANQTDMEAKMSAKIIPAVVAAALLASTGLASAQAPSAQGFALNPPVQSVTPYPYQQFNGYYNVAPTDRLYNSAAPRRGRVGGPAPAYGTAR
jgi:hypothetical protein